jgi:mono/diheme cytochrome c family protein
MRLLAVCAAVIILPMSAAAGAAEGKPVYDKSCRTCHGPEGQGNAVIAKMLKVELRHLGSPEVQAKSDDELKNIIVKGSGKMAPVANVKGKALDDVVAFVRTLKK